MYKQRKTFKKMVSAHGLEYEPVATLVDGSKGSVNIVQEGNSYVCFIFSEEVDGYVETPYLFPELHEALCSLPKLNEVTSD